MIITCINCAKQFELESSLIPEKGRLLQCNSCNQKWFFKKEIVNEPIAAIKINKPAEETEIHKEEEVKPSETESPETIELLDRKIKNDFVVKKISTNKDKNNINEDKKNDQDLKITSSKSKKNSNVLSLISVLLISFVALIIVFDTLQSPISKVFPNIEFFLYNLYETINDVQLFLKDLI
jgi:predicted Zn finger-like uncharacterized protein|tara:strand:- start:64 stop:603 length:540 start_codon:yes stop_codon:yes gene_type:complete